MSKREMAGNQVKKHAFNIFPEANQEDFDSLCDDIRQHGFDASQPIVLYHGDVLDGWNRWRACELLKVKPVTVEFMGDDIEAVLFTLRTNKRRNMTSAQKAAIGVKADELVATTREATERERREKISAARTLTSAQRAALALETLPPVETVQKIEPSPKDNSRLVDAKIAAAVGTNRTYINQAAKIKAAAPEVFEQMAAGKLSMQDARREVAKKPTDDWRPDERQRQTAVGRGETVVANAENDKNLILWAEQQGLMVRIDRSSKYGNPFVHGDDGDRDTVCDAFENHYLPHKPSILKALPLLKGKVLVCHCFPQRCHGDALVKRIDN